MCTWSGGCYCWQSFGQRRWQKKRCWYVPVKLGAYWKWFSAGSIDDLDMFSGMTTYFMTLSKGKCWARLLGVKKGWNYCMIWWKGEIMDSWKILISDRSRWRQDSKWECTSETYITIETASAGSAETLVKTGGITNHSLIAYSRSNISTKIIKFCWSVSKL